MTLKRTISDLTSNGQAKILTHTHDTGEPIVLTKYGLPYVAVVPVDWIESYRRFNSVPTGREALLTMVFSTITELKMEAKRAGDVRGAEALDYARDVLREKVQRAGGP